MMKYDSQPATLPHGCTPDYVHWNSGRAPNIFPTQAYPQALGASKARSQLEKTRTTFNASPQGLGKQRHAYQIKRPKQYSPRQCERLFKVHILPPCSGVHRIIQLETGVDSRKTETWRSIRNEIYQVGIVSGCTGPYRDDERQY